MKYRNIGNTKLKVSEIGIGCSGFWGNKNFSEVKAIEVIKEATQRGVNFFDTGHNYCNYNAEPRLGRAIKEITKSMPREKIIISTKAGTTIGNAKVLGKQYNPSSNYSPEYIEKCIYKSIQNLSCEYLDIFQLHGLPQQNILEGGLLEKLHQLKSKGVIRHLGVNTHNSKEMEYIAKNSDMFDMVLIDYNVLQLDRAPIIEKLSSRNIAVLAGTVLAQGHLIEGKLGAIKSVADLWYLARAILKPASRTLMKNSKLMKKKLSRIEHMSSAQAAIAYILNNQNISSCIIGTTKIKNLIQVIEASEKKLSPSEIRLIEGT